MIRKFSIPYSTSIEVDNYINLIDNYYENIESIYMGIPELTNHISLQYRNKHTDDNKVYDFLDKIHLKYKRIIVYNSISYNMDDYDLFKLFDEKIYPIIEKYDIDGMVITSLPLGIKLKRDYPNLELHTSCNSFQWNIRQMDLWREKAGINIFNPPREAAKTPSMLKEMYNAGFKLKVLVNEACTYGCPYTINHACSISEGVSTESICGCNDLANSLRSNLFLPEWLETIDEYVYCYKLAGRVSGYNKLKTTFDSYIHNKPYSYIDEISTYGSNNPILYLLRNNVRIKPSDIPEKTRYCEAKKCNKTCFVCSNAMSKINPM